MRRYLILANGPGEVWGWARPLLREILRRGDLPELCLLPCQYASGREKEAVEACLGVKVYPLSRGKLLLEPRKGQYAGIIQLGGDLFFGRYFARRYQCPLAVYTYGWKKGLRSCSLVATAFEVMQLRLQERGCPAFVTGDLVASALLEDPHNFTWHAPEGRRLVFFPGSRRAIRESGYSLCPGFSPLPDGTASGGGDHRTTLTLQRSRGAPSLEKRGIPCGFSRYRGSSGGGRYCSHPAGNEYAGVAAYGHSGIVAVPDRFLSLIPLPGILGGLASIPLLGPRIRGLGIHYLRSSLKDYLAWPNRIGGREILPERVGPCLAEDIAGEGGGTSGDSGTPEGDAAGARGTSRRGRD